MFLSNSMDSNKLLLTSSETFIGFKTTDVPDFFNDNGSTNPPSINLAIKTFKPLLA